MKFINNFKRKSRYVTDEQMARLEIISENDLEDFEAIHSYGTQNLMRGYNTGVLATAAAAGLSWVCLKIYDFAKNHKKHEDEVDS